MQLILPHSIMKQTLIAVFTLLFLSAPVFAEPEQWPRFRGPNGQGISTATGLPTQWSATENIAWKTPIPGEGWSSPVIWNNHIFLTSATDGGRECRVIAVDRRNGEILWNTAVFTQELTSRNPRNSRATPTPVTDGERVYALFPNGHFVALDFEGNIVWINPFEFYSGHGLGTSPMLYEDLLITAINPSNRVQGDERFLGWQRPWDQSFLLAIDKNTGEERWRTMRGMTRISHSVPVVIQVDGKDQILSMVGDVVQGFEPATGELIWTVRSSGEPAVPTPAIGEGGMVFASTIGPILGIRTDGKGDVTNTHVVWQQGQNRPLVSSFLYVNSVLYAADNNGSFAAINPANGEILWTRRLEGGRPDSSPIYADGKIYITTHEGITTILRPNADRTVAAEVVATNDIGAMVQATFAIAGNQIFLRTDNELWCIGR